MKDAPGNTRHVLYDSGSHGGTLIPNEQIDYAYNVLNEPVSVTTTDETPLPNEATKSVTVNLSYDDLGRLVTLADPDRGTHTYTYDADGHVTSDVSGTRTLGESFDLLGRLGCEQTAAPTQTATGACTGGNPLVQNTYDISAPGVTWTGSDYPKGRLTQSVATTSYPTSNQVTTTESVQYDQRGRIQTQQLSLGVPSTWNVTLPVYQLSQSYNDINQPTTTQTSTIANGTSTSGYTVTQDYDSFSGVLVGLSSNGGGTPTVASLLENENALANTLTYYTSAGSSSILSTEQFSYDGDLRPQTDTATWGSGSGASGQIASESRWYDAAGNVASLSTTQAAVPGQSGTGGSETENYCYDEQNRLVFASNTTSPTPSGSETCGTQTPSNSLNGASYTESLVYTHLGQLWQGPVAGGSTEYQYLYCGSAPHQLSGLFAAGSTCASKSGSVYKSGYDTFGNVTSRTYSGTTATLSYDSLDRLVKWGSGSSTYEQYAYDASGNRSIQRTVSGGTTTITVYAFGLEEYQYSSSGTLTNATHYYTLGGKLIGALTGLTSPSTVMFLTDALGSLLATLSNTAGSAAVQGNQVYGPYGTQLYSSHTSMDTAKGYTGQYSDSLTGLDYYISRYYDPVVGVFLSADVKEGNAQGLNPYAYVGGNPETRNDPTGQRYIQPPCCGSPMPPPSPPPPSPGCNQPQPQSGPVAQGGAGQPYFPGEPRWQQVGSLIGYGYQNGGLLIFADIIEAFRRHQSTWMIGGQQVSLDDIIAYLLALTSGQWRQEFQHIPGKPGGFAASNNVGAGYYYITDQNGNLVSGGAMPEPVNGYDDNQAAYYGQYHSEQRLLSNFYGTVIPGLQQNGQLQKGDTLHYILFSQIPPCNGFCGPSFSAWANTISKRLGSGVSFDFKVYTTNFPSGMDPRTTPVTSFSDIMQYYP